MAFFYCCRGELINRKQVAATKLQRIQKNQKKKGPVNVKDQSQSIQHLKKLTVTRSIFCSSTTNLTEQNVRLDSKRDEYFDF